MDTKEIHHTTPDAAKAHQIGALRLSALGRSGLNRFELGLRIFELRQRKK